MKSKRHIYILSLLIVALITLSAVSASENAANDNINIENDGKDIIDESINEDNGIDEVQSQIDNKDEQLILENNQDASNNANNENNEEGLSDTDLNDKPILGEDGSPGSFYELQLEINVAPDGSVLYLNRDYEGSEGAKVQLHKSLTIDGNGHTLDCKSILGCIAFVSTSGTITLKNLRIINGYNDGSFSSGEYRGGAIKINGTAQYTIINCSFENNYANDYGGAIYSEALTKLTIINSTFKSNKADDYYGGAIYYTYDIEIINSKFIGNTAGRSGGAVYVYDGSSHNLIEDSTFISNRASSFGGAIYISNSNLTVKNSTFESNKVNFDKSTGGAIELEGGQLDIESSRFISNYALSSGGAIYVRGPVIVNSKSNSSETIFQDNYGGDGGAIYSTQNAKVYNSKFIENDALLYGGAMYGGNNAIATNCTFDSNRVKGAGLPSEGGAIYANKQANAYNCTFNNNVAENYGGAIYSNTDSTTINCTFNSNRAEGAILSSNGGAIYVKEQVNIHNCTFNNNFAENSGGAIHAKTVALNINTNNSFIGNTAKKGQGGAIYTDYINDIIKFLTLYMNSAAVDNSDDGGALYISGDNQIQITQCIIVSNQCGDEGGAIYMDSTSSYISLYNNIIIANRAGDEGQVVFSKGSYATITNNWWGDINPSSDNDLLVEWETWGSNLHHVDIDPLRSQLELDKNIVRVGETVLATYYFIKTDGSTFTGEIPVPASFILPTNINKETEGKTENTVFINFKANSTGTYSITANMMGQTISKSMTVIKSASHINASNLQTIYGSVDYLVAQLYDQFDNPVPNAYLKVNLTDEIKTYMTNETGQVEIPINDLPVGTNPINIYLEGSEDYEDSSTRVAVIVNKNIPKIIASDMEIVYGTGDFLIAHLYGQFDNPIPNAYLNVYEPNYFWSYSTNKAGKIEIHTMNLPGGTNHIIITFNGSANYEASSISVNVIVNRAIPEIIASDIDVVYGSEEILKAALYGVRDLQIIGAEITVNLEGISIYITDGYGAIRVPIKGLNAGSYIAEIIFEGNENYTGITKEVNVNVNKASTKVTSYDLNSSYGIEDYLIATLTDSEGTPFEGIELTVDLNGTKKYVTNASGQIEIPTIGLPGGNHTATITFNGNENYAEDRAQIMVRIKPDSPILSTTNLTTSFDEEKNLTISLKDSQNRPIANAEITVFIEGFEEKTTDENGEVKISTKDMEIGIYNMAVWYYGNENYTASNTTANITITKVTPIISVTGDTVRLGDDATVRVKVTDSNNNPIKGMVTISVDYGEGVAKDVVELDENGEGQSELSINQPGTFTINAKFITDKFYTSAVNDTEKIIIAEAGHIIFDAEINLKLNQIIISNAKHENDSPASGSIEGALYKGDEKIADLEGTVNEGSGTIAIPEGLKPGTYNAMLNLQSPEGENGTKTVEFEINPTETIINIISKGISYGEQGEINFTLTDIDGEKLSGNLSVSIGNMNTTVEVKEGFGTVKVPTMNAGNYIVTADFTGNEKYASSYAVKTFNIAKATSQIVCSNMTTTAVDVDTDGRVGKYFTMS